jgi:site-specific DNA recombinase
VTAVAEAPDGDLLAGWIDRKQGRHGRSVRRSCTTPGGMRFAFYGRMSTSEFQDRVSSGEWQRDFARELIAGRGTIVSEFFDVGCSRRLAWSDRPQAAALLAALGDPGREFDAIVIGEYERAFYGDQLAQLMPVFERHGVQVWLPEAHGPVDFRSPIHQALMLLLGAQSKREMQRSQFRVMAAMQAQVREQGRHQGGRPPYGYRLADAGPHPNHAHALWGRRLHRLVPDPTTAPHVRRMFAQRLAGHSVASIARVLNEGGVACPSSVDRERNPHRSGQAWTLRTVAAILGNPRYTGRQVWNRQRTDHDRRDPASSHAGRVLVRRWNPTQQWVVSKKVVHAALVCEEDFVAAQSVNAVATAQDGTTREYLLVGLVQCRRCGRRMESHWVHGRPGYRCRHGHSSSKGSVPGRPRNLYLREDHILGRITTQLRGLGLPDEEEPQLTGSGVREALDSVRVRNMMIICDAAACTLMTNSTADGEIGGG